ncbi:MAG: adenylosuccinate lyase [Acidimicrobiia bacterium]|nr:adenylosuccinate lyase [Acidimicrobiia bacterium]MYE72687.1 adenylosuccinate lyase [Acidimicrobiia bacterium]MYJ61564.1 adenylosuccinate lyase [Acidimicrobiia bacterium]
MADKDQIPDVLADRYASAAMAAIWSPEGKIKAERRLWVAVLEAQRDLGIEVPDGVVEAYRSVVDQVDLESIRERERITRHDVKARIEEFCALAGHEHIHKGMTSRDLTENIEQLQVRDSLRLVRDKLVAVVGALGRQAEAHAELVMVGRSHNVPAQATTLGKRFANYGEEALVALERIEDLLGRYRLRGLKGPVGTQQDQLDLFLGDPDQVAELEQRMAASLGFAATMGSVGQVYPRSLDYDVVSALVQASSAPANLARTIRLMAGHGLISEGFQAGQVGSSAMPGKRNARTSERIGGLSAVVRGFADMVSSLVGDQWNEGDVSCSVVRRVALPGAFLALDGQLEAVLVVLNELAVFEEAIAAELTANLPALTATRVLMASVAAGAGREEAHRIISEHVPKGDGFFMAIAEDERLPIATSDVEQIESQPLALTGAAAGQARAFAARAQELAAQNPNAAHYQPESIL